jgi:hypothetical protein
MTVLIKRRQLAIAAAACCTVPAGGAEPAAPPPAGEDARTFRSLRAVRGHFEGGRWNDEVDRWQGRKHVAMQRIAEQVLHDHASVQQLRRLLGEPDGVLAPRTAAHARAVEAGRWLAAPGGAATPAGPDAELWLYRWRGTHDQMVLAVESGRVAGAGWLYEGE